ncbi:MAG: two-component system, response regulator PdtaR [Gaiellales bacterium]|jgi:response regulator NasT|nr:two-component system, response regulator PdtaR [Gaiellales bacterium]
MYEAGASYDDHRNRVADYGARIRPQISRLAMPSPKIDNEEYLMPPTTGHLRVLVANERHDRVALLAKLVSGLGHTVIAGSTNVDDVGALTSSEHPDVALVGLGDSSTHALELIERIVCEADCPVIAVLEGQDTAFVDEAAKRGVFAYIEDGSPDDLRSALDITLRRFAEYHNLRSAFGRRAVTERAKGIVMERYQVDELRAFGMLRDHARHSGQKLVHVAQAVLDGHLLLPSIMGASASNLRPGNSG